MHKSLAVSHYLRLREQGMSHGRAMSHTMQRFGILTKVLNGALAEARTAGLLAVQYIPASFAVPAAQWCPVCHTHHVDPGVKTDAGALVSPCPELPSDDPRNIFENFPPESAADRACVERRRAPQRGCGPCGTGGQYDLCSAHAWHGAV